jgi:integrase
MAELPPYPGNGKDPGAHAALEAGALFDLADAIEPRYRVLVLLLAFVPGVEREGIRECRRRHLDLPRSRMRTAILEDAVGEHASAAPEDESVRWAALPAFLARELSEHLDAYAQPDPAGYVFTGPDGGPLDLAHWHKSLRRAREAVGLTDIRPHDLHQVRGHDGRQ